MHSLRKNLANKSTDKYMYKKGIEVHLSIISEFIGSPGEGSITRMSGFPLFLWGAYPWDLPPPPLFHEPPP